MGPCGCTVSLQERLYALDSEGIVYCPAHAAAPALLDWLRAMLDSATADERCEDCGKCLYCSGRALLAQVEPT